MFQIARSTPRGVRGGISSHLDTQQDVSIISNKSLKLHAVLVATLFMTWLLVGSSAIALILGGIAYIIGCPIIARNEAKSTPLLVTPLSWWFVWQVYTMGLTPLWIGIRFGSANELTFVGNSVPMADAVQGYAYYALGCLAFHYGLQRARPRFNQAPADSRDVPAIAYYATILLWGIGIVLDFVGNRANALGTFVAPLQIGALAGACFIAIRPPAFAPMRSAVYWILLLIGTCGCVVAHAMVALKFYMMLSVVPIIWPMLLSRITRRALVVLLPVLGLVYLYGVEPVIDGLRTIHHTAVVGDSIIEGATGGTLGDVVAIREDSIADRLDSTALRQFYAVYMGFLIRQTQLYGYMMGETMDYLRYAFIPRVLWPEKPNVSRGAWYTVYLGGADSEASATSASAITAEGELFWNFGIPGMILGMAALGWLTARLVWRRVPGRYIRDPIQMVALITASLLVSGELEAGTMFVGLIIDGVMLGFMLWAFHALMPPLRTATGRPNQRPGGLVVVKVSGAE